MRMKYLTHNAHHLQNILWISILLSSFKVLLNIQTNLFVLLNSKFEFLEIQNTNNDIFFPKQIADMIAVTLSLFAAIYPDVPWDVQEDKWESLN